MAQPLITNYDRIKLFLSGIRTVHGSFINDSGSTASYAPGTVLGKITATGVYKPCVSTATDGSAVPCGILYSTISDLATATTLTDVAVAYKGEVAQELLVLGGSDELDTVVSLRGTDAASPPGVVTVKLGTIFDVLQWRGFEIVLGMNLTGYDNQ